MRPFAVTKKTGFEILDPLKPLTIRDERGILFYTTEPLTKKPNCFNMPPLGRFFIEDGNGIAPLEKPLSYNLDTRYMNLPRRHESDPSEFKVEFGPNPNKCTVKWDDRIILFDNMFFERPLPQAFFILYHEFAHAFSNDEAICDILAGNMMKEKGFNPSQIGSASINALSSRQTARKQQLVNSLVGNQ